MRAVAVASAKGGVGKTIIAANLVRGLLDRGYSVGAVDLDIDNPTLGYYLGIGEYRLVVGSDRRIVPNRVGRLEFISVEGIVGSFATAKTGEEKRELIRDIFRASWSSDVLVVDCPAGESDEIISLRLLPGLVGVVVVGQPNSTLAIKRIIDVLSRFRIRVLGVIENMTYVECPNCSVHIPLFNGSIEEVAKDIGVRFYGRLPFIPEVYKNLEAISRCYAFKELLEDVVGRIV